MNARVFVMIADYFKKMHEEVVWPTAGSQPPALNSKKPAVNLPVWGGDRLVEIRHALLKNYVKSVQVFDTARPCTTTYDCLDQNEVCIGGECRRPLPIGAESTTAVDSLGLLKRCTTTYDCLDQLEVCVNGFCVYDPYGLEPVAPTFDIDQVYLASLQDALVSYYARIQDVITTGLGKDPKRLPAVRGFLMEMYADLATAVDKKACTGDDCPAGMVCVKGRCVPYPFRLAFRQLNRPSAAPWA